MCLCLCLPVYWRCIIWWNAVHSSRFGCPQHPHFSRFHFEGVRLRTLSPHQIWGWNIPPVFQQARTSEVVCYRVPPWRNIHNEEWCVSACTLTIFSVLTVHSEFPDGILEDKVPCCAEGMSSPGASYNWVHVYTFTWSRNTSIPNHLAVWKWSVWSPNLQPWVFRWIHLEPPVLDTDWLRWWVLYNVFCYQHQSLASVLFRSMHLSCSWSFGIVLWEIATLGMRRISCFKMQSLLVLGSP